MNVDQVVRNELAYTAVQSQTVSEDQYWGFRRPKMRQSRLASFTTLSNVCGLANDFHFSEFDSTA
jgi:hypothetical protein